VEGVVRREWVGTQNSAPTAWPDL